MSVVIIFAVFISLARYFMPSLEQYEQQAADLIAKELQLNVHFETFTTDWYRFGPALKISGIELTTQAGAIVTEIDTLYVSFNLLNSLIDRELIPAYLNVIGLTIDLEQTPENVLKIINWPSSAGPATGGHTLAIDTLKKFNSITVRRSRINFHDAQGQYTPIYLRRAIFSRSGQNHQLEVLLNLLNHPTRLEMLTQINGDLAKPEQLAVHGYVQLNNLVLSQYLKPYQFKGYQVKNGLADLEAWIDWRAGQLQQLQAEVYLQQLSLFSPKQNQMLKPFDLKNAFLWKRENEQMWNLVGNKLQVRIDEEPELIPLLTKYELSFNDPAFHLVAKELELDHVSQVLLMSGELSEEQQKLLADLALQGYLRDLTFNGGNANWQLGAHFDKLSFQGWDYIPSLKNISGEVLATPASGKMSLKSEDTLINYTSLFPEEFFFSEVTGDITWQINDTHWQVKSDNFFISDEDSQLKSDFIITGADAIDTQINFNVSVDTLNSLNVYRYLPVTELSADFYDWMKTAIGPGHLEHIAIKAQGSFKDFPFFEPGTGIFSIKTNIIDQEVTFDPQWPKLEHLFGEFLLIGPEMHIVLDKAQIFQTDLLNLSADILAPEKGTSWLFVRGEVMTQTQQAIDFLKVTPLDKSISESLDLFTFKMPLTLTLDLDIPLDNEAEHTKVNGVVQVSEGDATLKEWGLKFSNLHGVFGFTENGVHSNGMAADVLGGPVLLTMTPDKGKSHLTHWKMTGLANVSQLNQYFPNDLWKYMQGGSQFSVNFVTGQGDAKQGFDIFVESDLKGIDILLPAPLGKTKDSVAPIRYTTTLGLEPHTHVRLQYNSFIDVIAQFSEVDKKQILNGAKIQLGSTLEDTEIPNKIVVSGTLPQFSYDLWEAFFSSLEKSNHPQSDVNMMDQVLKQIDKVDVTIDNFEIFDMLLNKAQIYLTQTANEWALKLRSKEWAGRINLPHAAKAPIHLNFDYCTIDNTQQQEPKPVRQMDPRKIPALNFVCKDFMYNHKQIGSVSFNAVPEPLGLKLDQVSLNHANESIQANGRWWFENNAQQTRLAGQLKSAAFDKTLQLLDIKSTIIGSKTQVDFSLSWPGNPFDFALAQLSGTLDVKLKSGVLVDVNPGFGRILSLLSIQSLQRRLRLDFSDVFKKGFSFDSITAFINITNGKAHSDNLLVNSPSAEVKMKGDVNLANKQLDLTATVIAHISGSLPLAATIASGGNPIVGAVGVGVWAVDKIVKSTGASMGSTYHITGTWETPIVKGK